MATNAALIRRWFEEVWNQGREATIDELCAKDAVGHGQTHDGSDIVGPGNFKVFWRSFRAGFSSLHVEVHQTIEEGELALARWTLTMMHTGPFLSIQPTQKKITARGMSIQRFVGGKIVEAWDNWDQLGVMVQLGVVSLDKLVASADRPKGNVA
jgi:predicted ester cyclase